jgi:hypothetical protein
MNVPFAGWLPLSRGRPTRIGMEAGVIDSLCGMQRWSFVSSNAATWCSRVTFSTHGRVDERGCPSQLPRVVGVLWRVVSDLRGQFGCDHFR